MDGTTFLVNLSGRRCFLRHVGAPTCVSRSQNKNKGEKLEKLEDIKCRDFEKDFGKTKSVKLNYSDTAKVPGKRKKCVAFTSES